MEKSTRRTYIRGIGAATAVGLAGCLNGGSNGNSGNSDNSGNNGNNGGKVGNAKKSNAITFEFWHVFDGALKKAIDSMCKDYNQQTEGVTVKPVSQGSYRHNLNQSLQANRAGNPPGIAQIFEIGTRLCIDSGGFTPVKDILPLDKVVMDDFLPAVKNYYTINGKLYSMPFNSSNAIMLYNKTAFKEAGLDAENAPRSLAGVRDAAETIVDQTDMNKAITWPNHSWMQIEQEFAKQDQVLIDHKNGRGGTPTKSFYNSDAGRGVYTWWKDIADAGLYINPGIEAWTAARQAFLTKKVAMLWDSTSNIAPMQEGTKKVASNSERHTSRRQTPRTLVSLSAAGRCGYPKRTPTRRKKRSGISSRGSQIPNSKHSGTKTAATSRSVRVPLTDLRSKTGSKNTPTSKPRLIS